MIVRASAHRRLWSVLALLASTLAQHGALAGPAALNLAQLAGDPTDTDEINAPTPLVTEATPRDALLIFRLNADFSCGAGNGRTELFLTVSDTNRIIDLSRRVSPQTFEIKVPGTRMPWLDGRDNCAARGAEQANFRDADGLPYFRLKSRANAFATLICPGAAKSQPRVTVTIPLDVWLRCPAEPIAPAQPPTDLENLKQTLGD
jgi:hypothetical protein